MADGETVLYSNCRPNWPEDLCAFGNICGLISTGIFIVVYLPQIYRNFRYRSVRGLSPYWSLANFTASINNLFFVFDVTMPVFNKIGGIWSPIVHGMLLSQFFLFTPHTRKKIIASCACILFWVTIIILQFILPIYEYMQWMSVVLWSVSSYPQVILNMKRQSTQGLSVLMVGLRQCSMVTWFFSTYVLMMPIQNYILSFFSGTGGFIMALQILLYWGQSPREIEMLDSSKSTANIVINEEKIEEIEDLEVCKIDEQINKRSSKTCNIIRIFLSVIPCLFLIFYIIAIVWSLHSYIAIVAPIGVYAMLLFFHVFYKISCNDKRRIMLKLKHLFNCSDDTYTVKI